MREGHAGERELGVAAFVNLFGESVSTADEKHQPFGTPKHLLLHELRELHGGHFYAMFIQQDNMIGRVYFLEKQLTFKPFLFLLAHLIFQIRDGFHFKRKVKLDFADVCGDCSGQFRGVFFSDIDKFSFHATKLQLIFRKSIIQICVTQFYIIILCEGEKIPLIFWVQSLTHRTDNASHLSAEPLPTVAL